MLAEVCARVDALGVSSPGVGGAEDGPAGPVLLGTSRAALVTIPVVLLPMMAQNLHQ